MKNILAVTAAVATMLGLMTLNTNAQQEPIDVAAKLTLQHYLRAEAAIAGAERDAQLALIENQPASVCLDRVRAIISTRDDLESALNDMKRLDRQTHVSRSR